MSESLRCRHSFYTQDRERREAGTQCTLLHVPASRRFFARGHDFAHRAREAGWSPEEVAYYLGHNIGKGATVIQALIGDTPVSREHIKQKFKDIKG